MNQTEQTMEKVEAAESAETKAAETARKTARAAKAGSTAKKPVGTPKGDGKPKTAEGTRKSAASGGTAGARASWAKAADAQAAPRAKTGTRTTKAPAKRGTAAKGDQAGKTAALSGTVPAPEAAAALETVTPEIVQETVANATSEASIATAAPQESAAESSASSDSAASDTPAYDFGAAEEKLMFLQQKIRALKIPVVILLEGWSAAGKGTMAGELLEGLDPRGYKVCVNERFTKEEDAYPYLHRYWVNMPRQGNVTLFIGGWYDKICADAVKGKEAAKTLLEKAKLMEQMLACDGVVMLKFFIDISKKEQKRRLTEMEKKKRTCKLVCKADWEQNDAYSRWKKAYERARKATEMPGQEWRMLSGENKRACKQALYEAVIAAFESAIAGREKGDRSWDTAQLREHEPIESAMIQHLHMFEPAQAMEEDYKSSLNAAQKKLKRLQYEVFRAGIPVVIAFEGWDAAGKGGAIRRLTSAMDPRGFTVEPISAPTAEEKEHQHLWRFWTKLPARGEVRIFDRTWYGRVMVERIEGFCTEHQWMRAYEEINLFEKDLLDVGTIICKFWLQIDNEEQLKRFNARQKTPEKQWKITDEDWRNREKWPQYETAVDEMLQSTNTEGAPWTVVEADNKQYARIKVLHTVIDAMEKALNHK